MGDLPKLQEFSKMKMMCIACKNGFFLKYFLILIFKQNRGKLIVCQNQKNYK